MLLHKPFTNPYKTAFDNRINLELALDFLSFASITIYIEINTTTNASFWSHLNFSLYLLMHLQLLLTSTADIIKTFKNVFTSYLSIPNMN